MNLKKIDEVVNFVNGMSAAEWSRIKQVVDMQFSSKAAKVKIDDLELLKVNLEREFSLRRSE